MKKVKGSFTVEAALILPLWLALCVLAVDSGVHLYQETLDTVAAVEAEKDIDVIKLFYICNGIGDIIEDGDSIH